MGIKSDNIVCSNTNSVYRGWGKGTGINAINKFVKEKMIFVSLHLPGKQQI